MKLCLQCEKENPSSANCCMYCGALLSEETLDENARLQRDLNDANETIILLKQSLTVIQEQLKNQDSKGNKDEIQNLQKQLTEERKRNQAIKSGNEKQLSELHKELDRLKERTKKGSWTVFFITTTLVLAIILIITLSNTNDENNKYLEAKNEIETKLDENQNSYNELAAKFNDISNKYNNLRETFPLKITQIEFGNMSKEGTLIGDVGSQLNSTELYYLFPKIYFQNHLKESTLFVFEIHYYNESWHLEYNNSTGRVPSCTKSISTSDNNAILSGWGSETGGTWSAGNYTAEIWSNGVCLGSTKFTIY